jgi:murein DD-endopeptidase MepM/ murein hydrolase activator NlpD
LFTKLASRSPRPRTAGAVLAICVGLAVPSAAPGASGGGLVAPGMPSVEDVVCLKRCVGGRTATPGAAVQVKGTSLDFVTRVVFRGADGPIRSRSTYRNPYRVKAIVPKGALTSRPYVISGRGGKSNRSPHALKVVPRSSLPEQIFPVRGRHEYWDGWGAGRGHEGTDVGAACGTPLVAAVDGRVEYRAYHGAAGNYVVIDMKNSPNDQMYAHLLKPAPVRVGQSVSAGQRIGSVGETGNASGCHLHFEYWKGDWYGGGHPIDSEPYLRALDRKS